MRFALAVEGTRGDVQPMLALGEGLRAAGHEAFVCAPPDARPQVEGSGFEHRSVGIDVRAFLRSNAGLLTRGVLAQSGGAHRYLLDTLRRQLAALPGATADADAIVGGGVQLAGPSAAELHGVPYRFVAYCPILFPSRAYAPPVLPAGALPAWANGAFWRAYMFLHGRLLAGPLNRARARLGLGRVRDVYQHLTSSRPLLAADPELAPLPPDSPVAADQVGYLHPSRGQPLPPKLEAFLAEGPAPVYIGFGSMTDPDPLATTRLLLDAVVALGRRAILSAGWAELGGAALPAGVLAIGPVDHARLFPRMTAVVHHGGAGTTTTAARAGVPQVVVPHLLDQHYFGARVRDLGLGPPPLPRRRLTRGQLVEALCAVVENEIVLERAAEIGARLRARDARALAVATLVGTPSVSGPPA